MRHVAEQQSTSRIKPLTEPVLLILVSLASKPQHGYALMRDIGDLSQGRVEVTTGTLYGLFGAYWKVAGLNDLIKRTRRAKSKRIV